MEIEQKFKVGDIVTLKSGSPKMTVTKIIISEKTKMPNGFIKCTWFVDTSLNNNDFKQDALELVTVQL